MLILSSKLIVNIKVYKDTKIKGALTAKINKLQM